MAAVALICMTMTSVVLTSCSSDDDNSPVNKVYTLKVSLQMISEGDISKAALEYLNSEFNNKEVTDKFTGFYDAKASVDEIINKSLSAMKNIPLYGDGCEYKVYFKLFDADNSQV